MADVKAGRLSREELSENFEKLHHSFDDHEAQVEADRCYFCYDAPCMTACPTSIDIPMFIRQISVDNPSGAAETIFQNNILGGMCARDCPTETLCEQACVREMAEGKPVRIGRLQRYATDYYMENGSRHPFSRANSTGKKIAIVGAGPAGLSCAHRLATHGHDVTIYEARDKAGGLNEFGIAAYKTWNDFAASEVEFILEIGGIEIKNNQLLGRDITLDQLEKDYDAVFLSLGLPGVNDLGLDGEDADGCIDAVDFIAQLRQSDDLSKLKVGRNIVVIGGGMTAIDIAIQTKLLGAENVTIAYRRGKEGMNASEHEQELAQTNGVTIRHWLQPHSIFVEEGSVAGITLEYTSNTGGKLTGTGETVSLPADQIFKAIGQKPAQSVLEASGIDLDRGRILVNENRKTSREKVWAGGDCVAGGDDLTVVSVEDGKLAAEDIHRTLSQ